MHDSSYETIKLLKNKYFDIYFTGDILDVGSLDINGSYRGIFNGWNYVGLDFTMGKNVDVISFDLLCDDCFDLVISGQTFEHVFDDKLLITNMFWKTKIGGYCFIIAPSSGHKHCLPDYRRYTEKSLTDLAEYAGYKIIDTFTNNNKPWCDCCLVAKK